MKRTDFAALALIALTMLRIAATWTVFSATVDEPMHVSAGLQLYAQHANSYLPANPPLPRLVFALAPWLAGMDFDRHGRGTAHRKAQLLRAQPGGHAVGVRLQQHRQHRRHRTE